MSREARLCRPVGLSDQDTRLLRSICAVSSARPISYSMMEPSSAGFPDILIVEGNNPRALQMWEREWAHTGIPTLFFDVYGKDSPTRAHFARPLSPMKLLLKLDFLAQSAPTEHAVTGGSVSAPGAPRHDPAAPPQMRIGGGAPAQQVSHSPQASAPAASKARALVVDDSSTIRKQLEICLGSAGISCALAEDGTQALERVGKETFDVIFLDIDLPGGMNGYDICKTMRKLPNMKHVPVIMLTGRDGAFDRIRGSLAGCTKYLAKPVDSAIFKQTLVDVLNASQKK